MSLGKQFLSALIAEGSVSGLLQHGPVDHLFKASEIETFTFFKEFVKQYHKLPSEQTIQAHTGESLVPHIEPSEYYFDLLQIRYTELELKRAMKQANDFLHPDNKDPDKALEAITGAVMALVTAKHSHQMADFREAYDAIMSAYKSKWAAGDSYGLQLGWPSFDTMSGGLVKGDLVSFVGRPAAGKTMQALYAAHSGWAAAGAKHNPEHNVSRLFVSMEMSVDAIQQRLAAMHAHIPAGQLKKAELSTINLKKVKSGLTEIKGYAYPFWVVDGNLTATVEDIWLLARQLQPGAIFIDGAYLIKHPTERDRYRRVAENADLIKSELAKLAPTVASWQFAKTASKKNTKKGEKVGLEDIGYTDAIAQVSAIVLGLFEEESVETLKQRKVEILKGRNGETGSFSTNWNWLTMDFSEIEEQDVGELQFI